MHESGWVHRDVSTGNILVGDGPRLVDFEYAKRASEEDDFNIVRTSYVSLDTTMA